MMDWNLVDKSNGETVLSGNFINGNKLNFVEVRDGKKLMGIKISPSYAEKLQNNKLVDIEINSIDPEAKGILQQFKGVPVYIDDNVKDYEPIYSKE